MKKIIIMVMLAFSLCASSQTKVVDNNGEPLIGTVVFDKNGTPIGIVDKSGAMPQVKEESYPITLRCMGFENVTVEQPTDEIVMKEATYELGEVMVKPGERPACHLVCYVRETSGMMNEQDTLRIVGQYMVDYMLKDDPKAKGFPTWDKPRELNREIEQHSTSGKTLDKSDIDFLSWYSLVGQMTDLNFSLPEELHGKESGSITKKSKKLGNDMTVMQLSPSQLSIYHDSLADCENHTLSPGILKLLGMTTDITESWGKMTYNVSEDEKYNLHNLVAITISLKMIGRGKLYHFMFGDKSPAAITSYIEIFPIAIEYLTREEAKAVKKEKDATYPMTMPKY